MSEGNCPSLTWPLRFFLLSNIKAGPLPPLSAFLISSSTPHLPSSSPTLYTPFALHLSISYTQSPLVYRGQFYCQSVHAQTYRAYVFAYFAFTTTIQTDSVLFLIDRTGPETTLVPWPSLYDTFLVHNLYHNQTLRPVRLRMP